MAESRELRLQMRQRGAAIRKTKDVDFGFSFAAPAGPSATKTPATSRRLSRKTPQRPLSRRKSTREASVTNSTRRLRTPAAEHGERGARPGIFDLPVTEEQDHGSVDSMGNGAKRRRLNGSQEKRASLPSSTPSNAATSSLNSLIQRKSTRKAAALVFREPSIAEEGETPDEQIRGRARPLSESRVQRGSGIGDQGREETESEVSEQHRRLKSIASPANPDEDKENDISDSSRGRPRANSSPEKLQVQKRKRKKRKSIGQRQPKRRSLESVQEEDVGDARAPPQIEIDEEDHPTVLPEQKKKRRKRKSIGQQRPKRRSFEPVRDRDTSQELFVQQTIPDARTLTQSPAVSEGATVRPVQKEQANLLETAEQAEPSRKRRRDSDASVHSESESSTRVPKNSVHILVHRLSQTAALLQDDDDEDELQRHHARFPKRSGVNAVDVLSQIWRETTEKAIEALKEKTQKEGHKGCKGELKRKRKVVSFYGNELNGRLFDLSEAMDYNFSLSTRLKRVNKEKMALREEFLRIGQERGEVALKMDEVRRKHEENSRIAEEHNELNNSLHDLDLALARETRVGVQGGSGLEFLLRTVTSDISCLGEGGGLLHQVKDFNGLLEKATLALEGRSNG